MAVDSTLELYTLLYGWLFYNSIWEVLVATGVVYLPLLALIVESSVSAVSSSSEDPASASLSTVEVDLFITFFVVVIAAVPAIPLHASDLSYTPKALIGRPAQPVATVANSQTTYGGSISFTDYPNKVDLPLLWYTVLSLLSGFNRAVMEDAPYELNLREYANDLRDIRIDSPELQAEINDFYRDCYVPARSQYFQYKPQSLAISQLQTRFGADDTQWMGSHIFLETPGYYDRLRSSTLRSGFPWSALRDVEWDSKDHPIYGKPFCAGWWMHSSEGLAQKILQATDGMEYVVAAAEPQWDSTLRRDAVIRAALLNSPPRWTPRGYDFAYNDNSTLLGGEDSLIAGWQNRMFQGLAAYGLAKESISLATYARIVIESAPMAQALILMGLYALLPFYLLIGRFRLSTLMGGTLVLFIVKFWTVLWFFAWWVDQNLIKALYPNPGDLSTLFNVDMTLKRALLSVLTGLMYLVFPALLSVYFGMHGMQAAGRLDGVSAALSNFSGKASRLYPRLRGREKSRGNNKK